MSVEERLAYEKRVGLRQAVIAGLAGVLLVAGVAIQLGGPTTKITEQTLGLIIESKRGARDIIGPAVQALGYIALAVTLVYLFGVTRFRNPEIRPRFIGILAASGGIIAGVGSIAFWIMYVTKARHFASHGNQTWEEANHQLSSAALAVPQVLMYLGGLLSAIGIVMVALNAMRVGLLTRFMGYIGIFAGVLVIIPLVPVPIVEGFWLLALGYLFLGRWPSGLPPAWKSGQAEPWPSSQAIREERMRARGGGGGTGGGSGGGGSGGGLGGLAGGLFRPKPAPKPAAQPVATGAPARTRSSTPKRKRKRRH